MKPKSSGLRARRSLTFEERPYAGKTFYVDVKSASAKTKISQRIHNLGGQIEDFLTKDLTLLITDKTSTNCTKEDCSQKKTGKNLPLSRGQALLLKASSNQNHDANNNSNGLLQSAAKLGLQIETPAGFLRDSSKLLPKLKAETSRLDTSISGLSPITWDSEKENGPVIKVEDEEGLYRPLFKQFETFPQIFYNETGSPFDVGVVLTKVKESNNQSKKKSVGGALRGGYCESCDHWYKCSLREHLNSKKHKEFVSVNEHFETLNHTSSSLPNLKNFVGKYGLRECNDNQEIFSGTPKFSAALDECDSHDSIAVYRKLDSELTCNVTSQNIEEFIMISEIGQDAEKKVRHASKTEPVLERHLNHNVKDIPHSQSVKIVEERVSNHPKENVEVISLDKVKRSKSEKCSESSHKINTSMRLGRKFSVDDVIKSVTDDEEYFSSGEDNDGRNKDPMSKTSCIITKHLTSEISTSLPGSCHSNAASFIQNHIAGSSLGNVTGSNLNVVGSCHSNFIGSCHDNIVGSSHGNVTGSNNSNVAGSCQSNVAGSCYSSIAGSCYTNIASASRHFNRKNMAININKENSQLDFEANTTRFQNILMMHFSSSSFGDNGVSNVLSFLNSQHSRKSCDGQSHENGGKSLEEDNSVVEGSGNSSWALDKLSEVTDNNENIPYVGNNVLRQCAVNGNVLEHLIDDMSSDNDRMPVLQAEIESDKMEVEHGLMPVLESYDSEIMDHFCEEKSDKRQSVITLPEYSNITEESLQEKPQIDSEHNFGQNLKASYDIPLFNIRNNGMNNVTPDKGLMNNLKSNIYKSQTNSGSTIRNWLLPNDDNGSIRSINSPGNLNATLVNTSCNVLEKSHVESGRDITDASSGVTTSLNDIKETADTSKVADWIQRQDFVVAETADGNSRHGFETNILDTRFPCSINDNDKDNYEKDLKSCSEIRYGSDKVDNDDRSNFWSDSGTSISDCTLDNFRIGGGVANPDTGIKNSDVKDIPNKGESSSEILLVDEMSQDSNISAKTGLASIVTARGIKITGLSSLSSHFFNAVDSDVFTGTESSTVAYGNSRRNSECSFADSINKTKPNEQTLISNNQQDTDSLCQNFNVKANQNLTMNNNVVCYDNSSEFDYLSGVQSNIVADVDSSQKKKNSKNSKSHGSTKKQSQAKVKKPRATKSKNQTKSHNLLNQVLTSNLYSPVSSVTGNSPSRNSLTDQTYSQYQQASLYSHHVGQGNSPNPGLQKGQGLSYFQQSPNVMNGQVYDSNGHYNNPYQQNNGEFRMMDLLLSPGEQGSKLHLERFQQDMHCQQYNTQGNMCQTNNVGWNGGYGSNVLSQHNIHHQFGVLPFPGAYQTQDKTQGNKENSHQFLSSSSNFFMHNWNTGSNVQQQYQSSQQGPANHVNYPASPCNMSHDHSKSNGSLKTIEMSHIADSNGVCENNFNFKIANTKKLKSDCNVKKKPKEKKQKTQRKKTSANSYNSDVQSTSHENKCLNLSGSFDNVQQLPTMSSPYNHQNHFSNVNTSSYISQPLHVNTNDFQNLHSHNYSNLVNQTSSDTSINIYNRVQPTTMYDNIQNTNMYNTSNSVNMYEPSQTGNTKLTNSNTSTDDPPHINKQSKHDLMQYWNVRKAGDCRLVFSANIVGVGKRKAEAETPTKICMSPLNNGQTSQPVSKRRKCLVY